MVDNAKEVLDQCVEALLTNLANVEKVFPALHVTDAPAARTTPSPAMRMTWTAGIGIL